MMTLLPSILGVFPARYTSNGAATAVGISVVGGSVDGSSTMTEINTLV